MFGLLQRKKSGTNDLIWAGLLKDRIRLRNSSSSLKIGIILLSLCDGDWKGKESFIAPAGTPLLITLYMKRENFHLEELMNLIKHIKSLEEFKIIQMYWFVLKLLANS